MFTVRGLHGSYSVRSDVLSKGGVGAIHRTTDPGFVYKQYFSADKAPSRPHLERLTGIGRDVLIRQGRKPGESPESSVNWPVDLVPGPGGTVTGVVLPLIPDELFNEFGSVRGLEFLVMARANPPGAKARIVLLLRMAEILAFVNARGLIHGDVNGKNLAWSVDPAPVMYLIDCDGMVPQQPPPTTGVQAMGWTDPRIVERRIPGHDQYSDWYALALAMYRGLLLTPGRLDKAADGSWPGPGRIPPSFPPALTELLRRGLDPLRQNRRPAPQEWVNGLVTTYLPGGAFDEKAIAALDAISTPAPRTQPFVPLPTTDWRSISRPPTAGPPPAPPSQPRPPTPSAPTPPRRWSAQSYGPSGNIGRYALHPDFSWWLKGLAASLLISPIAVCYVAVGLFQLRRVDDTYPGIRRARTALMVFGAIAAVVTLIYVIAAITPSSQT
jgi:hypothetical protein